jgi:hypothetical protein
MDTHTVIEGNGLRITLDEINGDCAMTIDPLVADAMDACNARDN